MTEDGKLALEAARVRRAVVTHETCPLSELAHAATLSDVAFMLYACRLMSSWREARANEASTPLTNAPQV